jgi:hypothetical protein
LDIIVVPQMRVQDQLCCNSVLCQPFKEQLDDLFQENIYFGAFVAVLADLIDVMN